MADQPPEAPAAATADLESKEIWGDDADQLDDEIAQVRKAFDAVELHSSVPVIASP